MPNREDEQQRRTLFICNSPIFRAVLNCDLINRQDKRKIFSMLVRHSTMQNKKARHYRQKHLVFRLFILSIVPPVVIRVTAIVGRRLWWRRGRWSIVTAPLHLLIILFIWRRFDLDKHRIHADFRDMLDINEKICLPPAESSSTRHDNSLHLALRKSEYHITDSAELFSIANIHDLLLLQFQKTRFHDIILCSFDKKIYIFSEQISSTESSFSVGNNSFF